MILPMVRYFTSSGETPAIVLKEVAPERLNLFVIHQNGRTETVERVSRCIEPRRDHWMPYEQTEPITEAIREPANEW